MEENNTHPSVSLADRFTFGLILLVVFLSPMFFVPGSFISVQFGTSLLFAFGSIFAVFAYIASHLKKGSIDIPESKLFVLGGLVAVPLVYTLSSISQGFSRMSFLGYTFDISTVGFIVLGFVFVYLVSSVFKNRERIFYSYAAIVVSLLSVTTYLVLRMIFGVDFLSFGVFNDLTSTAVGGWNNTGIFLGLGVILSLLTLEMLSLTKTTRILVSVALLASLFFLSLVNFSIIWVIVGITSLLFLVYKIFSKVSDIRAISWADRLKSIPLLSLGVLVIAIAFTVGGGFLGSKMANLLNVSSIDVRPTLSVTLEIAQNTMKSHPIFGSGPNTFATQWLSYKPADINSTIFWNTDFAYGVGLLPTFAVTTGALGVISWILFFVVFLMFGVRAVFSKNLDQFSMYLSTSSFFIALYLWIMSFIYVPSIVVFIFTLFFTGLFFATLYMNGILRTRTIAFNANPRMGFGVTLAMVSTATLVGALGYGLLTNSRSLWHFQKSAYAANVSSDIETSERELEKAISLVPYDVYYRAQSELALLKISNLLSQDLSKANKEEVSSYFRTELAKAINAATNAQRADDSNYLNWIALGRAFEVAVPTQTEVAGAYERAVAAYTKAFERNPQNPGISLLFARLESAKNNLKKAKEYAFLAINQKQNYTDAYYFLAQLEVADKNIPGAIDSVTAATIIEPNNPGVFFQLGLLKYNAEDFPGAIEAFKKSIELAPDYANSKYFLGLSFVLTGDMPGAIAQFEDLAVTNPESKEVTFILENLKAGKSPFANAQPPITPSPENRQKPPVRTNE